MSKLLMAGSRTDCATVVSGSLSESTSYIDGAYSDAGIQIASGVAKFQFYDPGAAPLLADYAVEAGNALYFHFYFGADFAAVAYSGSLVTLLDSANYPWLFMDPFGNWHYNSGTGPSPVWTAIGDNIAGTPWLNRGQATIDIKVQIDAGGNHSLFMAVNSVAAVATVNFNQPLMTNLSSAEMTIGGTNNPAGGVVSQILATENISTVGAHVQTSRATGAGAHSDWTGSYTDVNEQITDFSNYNEALTAGLEQSYPMGNIDVPAGYVIQGVFHWLVAKNDGTSPENLASLIRTSAAVDHVSANLGGPGITFEGLGARYDVNPDTGLAWTAADWNNPVQLGFVSEA